jgi:hypothetical protein
MLAGLNPAQGLIFMLQALGGDLISVDLAQREMPFGINVTQEQEKIEVEKLRKALIGSLTAYTQTIPQMATQGQDPLPVIQKIAMAIKGRKAGKSIEDVIEEVFTPENPPAGTPVEQPVPSAPGAPVGGAPGQAGRPDLQMLLSRLNSSGEASGSVQTQQQRVI